MAIGFDAVGVVAGFGDPAAAAGVPGHGDRFGDIGFAGEEFELEVGGDLGALHAALHAEGVLQSEGLGAALVVGDVGIGGAGFGFALGEEGGVVGAAGGTGGGEEFFLEGLEESLVREGRGVGGEGWGDDCGGGRLAEGGEAVSGAVEEEGVEAGEVFGGQLGGIGEVVEPDGVAAQLLHEDVAVVTADFLAIAEEKHPQRGGGGGGEAGKGEGEGEGERAVHAAKGGGIGKLWNRTLYRDFRRKIPPHLYEIAQVKERWGGELLGS